MQSSNKNRGLCALLGRLTVIGNYGWGSHALPL